METNAPQALPALEEAQESSQVSVKEAIDITDGADSKEEHAFVKKVNDFYVEFFETEKKTRVAGSEVASSLLTQISLAPVKLEVKAKPGRKKKNPDPVQNPEIWNVLIDFYDDVGNEAQKFIKSLSERDEPFRIRIVQTNPQGDPVEAVLLKDCQVNASSPPVGSVCFNVENDSLRYAQVHIQAEKLSRKYIG